jgi:hypothetical protein
MSHPERLKKVTQLGCRGQSPLPGRGVSPQTPFFFPFARRRRRREETKKEQGRPLRPPKGAAAPLNPTFLQESYFLFIDSDLEECTRRVRKRVTEPSLPDNHFVSEHIMRTYYGGDDWEYMAHKFEREFGIRNKVMVTRNGGPIGMLLDEVSAFAEEIFRREFDAHLSKTHTRSKSATGG